MVEALGDSQKSAAAAGGSGDTADAATAAKHAALADDGGEGVGLIENKFTRNLMSPFVNHKKSWDDEDDMTAIAPEMVKGIVEELGFLKPSKIQGLAVPMIATTMTKGGEQVYADLIAQSKNGSGKTGAFAIGSSLRVDPAL